MLPTREAAEMLLQDAEKCNPGPWGNHSRTAAHCAEKIAQACGDMDANKAYILGLLHDIGRKFGVRHLGHISDGYTYMMTLGYDEVAKICLTRSTTKHWTNTLEKLTQLQKKLPLSNLNCSLFILMNTINSYSFVMHWQEQRGYWILS